MLETNEWFKEKEIRILFDRDIGIGLLYVVLAWQDDQRTLVIDLNHKQEFFSQKHRLLSS